MKTKATIVKIGNSKGVRLPKSLLEQARLPDKILLAVEDGKIIISADSSAYVNEEVLMAMPALLRDWNRPEEDEAWKDL